MRCFADFNGLLNLGRYLSNAGAGNLNRYEKYNTHTVYLIQNFLLFSEVFLSVSWNVVLFFSSCKLIFWRIFFLFGGYLLSQSWIWKILHMPNKDKKHNFATVCINSTHRSIVFLSMLPTVPMATHSIQLILDIFPIFELFGRPCTIIKFFTLRQWNQTQNWSRSMEQFKDV